MTRIFTEDGESHPCDGAGRVEQPCDPSQVPGIRRLPAIQVTYGTRRATRVVKPQAGHYAKAGAEAVAS